MISLLFPMEQNGNLSFGQLTCCECLAGMVIDSIDLDGDLNFDLVHVLWLPR